MKYVNEVSLRRYCYSILMPGTMFIAFFLPGERLQQVTVYLGENSGSFSVTCGTFTGPGENAEVIHIVCNKPATGRFVKIQMNNFQRNRYLTLCEIRILV